MERSLLMLDAVSWARWIAEMKREEAARCEREGRIPSLAKANGQLREIERWLVTGQGLCKTTHVLYRRQLFAAPVVTAANYDLYVRRLLRLRAESATVPPPEFLFDAHSEPPMLFVTDDTSAAARQAGPHVQGQVVDRREMMRLVLGALRGSNRSLRLLLQQDDLFR